MAVKRTQLVFNAVAATTTTVLDPVLQAAASVTVDVVTSGFSGTLDFQGREYSAGTMRNIGWQEIDDETSASLQPTNDQISYTLSTGNFRYLIPVSAIDMQVVMTRTAGSITLYVSGVGEQLQSPFKVNYATARQNFVNDFLSIAGDVRTLWTPLRGNTTTTIEQSRYARVFTYDATVAARFGSLGDGLNLDFDGTDDEADTPDQANLSFGDGTLDSPMTVIALCRPDNNTTAMTIANKENSATVREWSMTLNSSGHLIMTLTDESAAATLIGTYATGVGTSFTLLATTYDGTRVNTGITHYVNGAAVTTAATGAGTYVAMEDTVALVSIGARYTTRAQFFDGRIAFVAIIMGALSADEHWAIKTLVNSYYKLSL